MLNCLFPEPNSDHLISGPTKIEDDWLSFKEAGFTKILTILPDTDNQDRAYFFSGVYPNQYMLVDGIGSGTLSSQFLIAAS